MLADNRRFSYQIHKNQQKNIMSPTLKIVPTDLARHEESIIQALNGLEHLNNVIQDAFDRMDSRIEKNFKRLETVSDEFYINIIPNFQHNISFSGSAAYTSGQSENRKSHENHKQVN
jgi:WAHD domain of WASH complex